MEKIDEKLPVPDKVSQRALDLICFGVTWALLCRCAIDCLNDHIRRRRRMNPEIKYEKIKKKNLVEMRRGTK